MITLSERKKNYVNVVIPLKEGVDSYIVFIANSLANAYDPAQMVQIATVGHNKTFMSPVFKKHRNPHYELGVNSKVTRIVFDPMEYYDPTQNTPTDDQQLYLRVQEVKGGVPMELSEILIVPPANFFMYPSGAITLVHNAVPNHGTKSAGDLPDDRDLSVVVPNYLNFFRLVVPSTSNGILYSPNKGMPYIPIASGAEFSLFSIANNQLFFAGDGGDATLNLFLTCSLDPIDG